MVSIDGLNDSQINNTQTQNNQENLKTDSWFRCMSAYYVRGALI